MQNINKVFFLAAGLGTRLKPFTDQIAKPAIPFWGLPQILYPYHFTQQLGIKHWAYNTHHHRQTLQQALAQFQLTEGQEFFEKDLLDSGGGIFNAKSFLETEEHFLVINADSLFIYQNLMQFEQEILKHIHEDRLATLFTIAKEGAGVTFSGLHSHNGTLTGAGLHSKNTAMTGACTHYIGIGLFSKKIFSHLTGGPQNIIHDVLVPLASQENIHVSILNDWDWFELGKTKDFVESFDAVKAHLQSGRYSLDSFSSFYKTQKYFTPHWDPEQFISSGIEKEILGSH
ncbi:MAG: sugar phosphate nucleotidyltransferase [Bdellovibrionaceae bacterium]|nr:sugar phosphate nucleotidyltransferase [Pseudobdellovibrionaceae bacterium]